MFFLRFTLKKTHRIVNIKGFFWGEYEVEQSKPEVLQTKPEVCNPILTRLMACKPELTRNFKTYIVFSSLGVFFMYLMKNNKWSVWSSSSSSPNKVPRYISDERLCLHGHWTLEYECPKLVFTVIATSCFSTYVDHFPDVCNQWFTKCYC